MWPRIAMLALGASLIPLGACAQSNDGGGPSPEMREKLDAVRGSANTASLATLSIDHRAKVQAIVDGFDATDWVVTIAQAAAHIDAVLDKGEAQAVLAQQQKMRDAMHAIFANSGDGPGRGGGPSGPGGGPGPDGPAGGGRGHRHSPDAGRFLLSVDATPERFRQAERTERGV